MEWKLMLFIWFLKQKIKSQMIAKFNLQSRKQRDDTVSIHRTTQNLLKECIAM